MTSLRRCRCHVVLTLLAAFLVSGCITRIHKYAFEVRQGTSIEDKKNRANLQISEQRIDGLKRQLKQRFPSLTERQLQRFGVRWDENWSVTANGAKANQFVTMTVYMQDSPDADIAAIVEAAARILDLAVNGPQNRAIDP